MREKILLWSFVLLIFMVSCVNTTQPVTQSTTQSDSDDDVFVVELQIHDFVKKSFILNDRILAFVDGEQTDKISLSSEEVDSLKQVILENGFFSLENKYEGTGCCDFVAHTIKVTVGDKEHAVYCYNSCPAGFDVVKDKIKGLWKENITYSGFS